MSKELTDKTLAQPGAAFDYRQVSPETAETLRLSAARIRGMQDTLATAAANIGCLLLESKNVLGHGAFTSWINVEFSMTDRTARNYISLYEAFGGKTETVSVLPMSALYALSSPAVSEEMRLGVVDKLQSDSPPSVDEIMSMVRSARAAMKTEPKSKVTASRLWNSSEVGRTERDLSGSDEGELQARSHSLYLAAQLICKVMTSELPVLVECLRAGGQSDLVKEIDEYMELAGARQNLRNRFEQ